MRGAIKRVWPCLTTLPQTLAGNAARGFVLWNKVERRQQGERDDQHGDGVERGANDHLPIPFA